MKRQSHYNRPCINQKMKTTLIRRPHCSKSSFLSKNSTLISRENCRFFWGENLVKMLWFWTFQLLKTLISREKLSKKKMGKKVVKMLWFWTFQLLTTLISREKLSKKIWNEKLVKMLWFWTFQLLTTLISREKLPQKKIFG